MEKFSVLISLYAKENPIYLQESLESIFTNTIQPEQVVLVIDGPIGHNLQNVVSKYQQKYSTLEIYPLPTNQGLSTALNIGLEKCKNDIVFRMDTDDICFPNRFETILKEYEKEPEYEIIGSAILTIDEKGNVGQEMRDYPHSQEEIYKQVWKCPFAHPTVSFRKSAILRVGSYNPHSGPRQDDYELWFRCVAGGLKCKNIGIPLLYYRFNSSNLQRMDLRVGWWRAKVGLKGSWMCKCSPIAYIGVFYPLFRSMLPLKLQQWLYNKLRK
jgi:glycosyltransferase involved in cell wall biosynthesis